MYKINDSMLTLILRFAGCNQEIAFSNQEFLREQVKAIQAYVGKYPPEERKQKTIEWIAERAREYRETWEEEHLTREVSSHRCPDCPLAESGDSQHCRIHEQWLELLQRYAADEITSRKYIEDALVLLSHNKKHLRIRRGVLRLKKAG